jgi:hypothetical protein
VALKVEAVPGAAPDAAHAYTIDPASLQTLTSIGTFRATWHDDSLMLSSINVTAEDRTAAIAANVITTASHVARLVAAPGAERQQIECTAAAAAHVETVGRLKPELDGLNEDIQRATAEIERLTRLVAQMGAAVDEGTKTQLRQAIDQLATLRIRQQNIATALASALSNVTSVQTIRWPLDSNSTVSNPYTINSGALQRWFQGSPPRVDQVHLRIERVGSFGRDPNSGTLQSNTVSNANGIRYRVPAIGRLVACSASPCSSATPQIVLTTLEAPIAQLGYVHVLPVRNRTFGSTTFAAEFNSAGGLRNVGYEQKAAPAEGASATLAAAAGALETALDPTARLQRQTAYLTALQARQEATAALQPGASDPVGEARTALEADTSLINAQIANLQAQLALERARAASNIP